MNLPKRITPCPIIDALLEIRFVTSVHPSAIFGIFYNSISAKYPTVEKLPILQVPEPIRENDPSFQFKPYFKVTDNKFIVQIGPDVITISSHPKYAGWDNFSTEIFSLLQTIQKLNIVKNVVRLGLRYINFFPLDIFDNINLEIIFQDKKLSNQNTLFRGVFVNDPFKSTLQITNDFAYNSVNGSLIDIDTYNELNIDSFNSFKEIINKAHLIEKELFFSLLADSYLALLQPEY